MSNVSFMTLVDSSVIKWERVVVQGKSITCAETILIVNISIGKYVIINLDYTIGLDDYIYDFVMSYPSVNVSENVIKRWNYSIKKKIMKILILANNNLGFYQFLKEWIEEFLKKNAVIKMLNREIINEF